MSGEERRIKLTVNGTEHECEVEPRQTLADVLRDELRLTGTHLGCEHGVCGSCTVIVDGDAVRSCLLYAVQLEGASVTTVEGVAAGDELHPVQEAFRESHALQCGFCTPGLVMSAVALLDETADPSDDQILDCVGGHLCRCTGYASIVRAVRSAAGRPGPEA